MIRPFALLTFAAVLLAPPALPVEQNQLDGNENLFTVLAALNAAGYDTDVQSPNNSPLRGQVRQYLAQRDIPVLPELREFYKAHPPGIGSYISLALSIGPPPDFAYKTRSVDVPPDAAALEKFLPLLARFYQEAAIATLWKRVQPAYDAAIEAYHEPVIQMIATVNSYFRNPANGYLGRRFLVYVDLLAAPGQVQTRSYGDIYYVVATNAREPHMTDIRHAYLHFLVEPLVAKYGLVLMKNAALGDYAAPAPALDDSYKNDFVLLTAESLIKAVESRLDHKPGMVPQDLSEGYILTPFFAEQLITYEKEPAAMRLYFPEMLNRLDAPRERKRLEGIAFAPKDPAKPVRSVDPVPVSASLRTIEQAEQFYTVQDYEQARKLFLKSLEQAGGAADHARGYYGLARISLRQNNPELAQRLFEKTLELTPDDPTHAWSLVYLGRLSDLNGDHKAAALRYEQALAVKGASDQALAAAKKGLLESKNQ
ncbi:MAG: tetratricopeptide repeat protein [Acidobacteriota bacterium]|nr:tetratricopeptide repeat protein [Acidobacteriota bacterium]